MNPEYYLGVGDRVNLEAGKEVVTSMKYKFFTSNLFFSDVFGQTRAEIGKVYDNQEAIDDLHTNRDLLVEEIARDIDWKSGGIEVPVEEVRKFVNTFYPEFLEYESVVIPAGIYEVYQLFAEPEYSDHFDSGVKAFCVEDPSVKVTFHQSEHYTPIRANPSLFSKEELGAV